MEVISALMRAGCILVALDLRGNAQAEPQQQAGAGAAGASAHRLDMAVATAVQQWLGDTALTGQLAPAAQVLVQVCNPAVQSCVGPSCAAGGIVQLGVVPSAGYLLSASRRSHAG